MHRAVSCKGLLDGGVAETITRYSDPLEILHLFSQFALLKSLTLLSEL